MTIPALWNTGSGAWFNAANWDEPNPTPPPATLHYVPGPDNDVNIPDNSLVGTPFTVTYAGTSTINTLASSGAATLEFQTGSLTIDNGGGTGVFIENGYFNIASGFVLTNNAGTLSFNGGHLAGTMAGNGTFRFINGTFDLDPGLSVTVANWLLSYQVGRATVSTTNLNTDLTYAGNFTIDSPFGNPAILNLNSHTLTLTGTSALGGNVVGPGTIRILGDATFSTGTYSGGVLLQVAKTVSQTGAATQTGGYGLLGTLQVDAGTSYTITAASGISSVGVANQALIVNNGTFADNGVSSDASRLDVGFTNGAGATLSVAAGATLKIGFADFRGVTTSLYNGAITGAGTLWLGGASTLNTTTLTVGSILASDGTTIGRNLTYGGQFTLATFATLELGGRTLTLSGTSDFTKGFNKVDGPGTLRITGTSTLAGVTIGDDAAATLRNSGAATQTASITLRTGSTLQNDAGKTYTLAGGDITLIDASTVTNAGTLLVTNANTALHMISGGSFTNTGTLTVGAGATLQISSGTTATLGGTVGGAGSLVLAGAVAVNTQVGTPVLTMGGIATLGVDLDYAGAFTFATFGRINLAGHTLTLSGTAALTGGFNSIDGPGTVKVTGSGTFAGFSAGVTAGVTLQNSGAVTQIASINLYNASALLNDAGRTYTLAGGDVAMDGGSSFTNNGTLLVTTANTALHAISGGSFTNAGTLTVGAGATLQLGGGSATLGGTVGGAGALVLAGTVAVNTQIGTATLSMAGVTTLGVDLDYAGAFTFGAFARINLASHTLTLSGTAALTGGFNRIDGSGTLKVTGSATFAGFSTGVTAGVTLQNSGAVTQTASITLDNASTLLNDATRTYTLDGGDISLNGGSSMTNSGTLLVTAANTASHAIGQGSFTNAGTLTVGAGASLALTGQSTLGGSIGGPGSLAIGNAALNTAVTTAGLTIGFGGTTTLGLNTTYAGAFAINPFATLALGGRTLTLTGSVDIDGNVQGSAGVDRLIIRSASADLSGLNLVNWTAGTDILQIGGTTGADSIRGSTLDDSISGGNGVDTLEGGNGNDTLDGGRGADSMAGGAGNDLYLVDSGGDIATDIPGGGQDTVQASVSTTLGAWIEDLVLTGRARAGTGNTLDNHITGTDGANSLSGMDGADTLIGGGGADTLDGGAGADSMAGGTGGDVYVVDDPGDVIVEAAGGGTDEVRSSLASFTLAPELENLTLLAGAVTGIGNTANNTLTGNNGDNSLSGLDGRDLLLGGSGDDTLDGGSGTDTLEGGAGRDSMIGGTNADVFRWLATNHGRDTIAGFVAGQDDLAFSASGFGGGLVDQVPLTATQLEVNATGLASTTAVRFVLNTVTSVLTYDADGSGSGKPVTIVTFADGPPALTTADFVIIA